MWPLNWWTWIAAGVSAGVAVVIIRRRVAGNKCRNGAPMTGKTVVITGANSGIGKATALELAKRGARVIMACRDKCKAEKAVQEIRRQTSCGQLIVRKLDLASLQSVRHFASCICQEEMHIDVLVNNAGVCQYPYALTEDGLEMQMAVNHFGHFLLVHLLLDKLKGLRSPVFSLPETQVPSENTPGRYHGAKSPDTSTTTSICQLVDNTSQASAPSRIVIVSSLLHKYGHIDFENLDGKSSYNKRGAYCNSKLANNLFARELARRTEGSGISVYCLRPGIVRTDLGRHVAFFSFLRYVLWPVLWLLMKSPYEGCQTVMYCAVAEELQNVSGQFYANCSEEPWSRQSLDDFVATKLWNASEVLTGVNINST